jgi:O-antigen ligase
MKNKYLYIFGFLLILLLVYISQSNIKIYSFVIMAFFLGLISIATTSRDIIFLAILAFFYFFPQMNRYEILPTISDEITVAILLIFLFSFLSKMEFDNSYNFLWLIFCLYIVFQIFRGIQAGYNGKYILDESVKYLLYPLGFYFTLTAFTTHRDNSKSVKVIIRFNLIMGLVIIAQMLFYYFFITNGNRVITRQANLLLLSLMTSLSLLVYLKQDLNKKVILILLSLLYVLGILIFMQRSLWIATLVSLFSFVIIYLVKSKFQTNKVIIIIIIIVTSFFLVSSLYKSLTQYNAMIESRVSEVQEEGSGTLSIAMRLLSFNDVLRKIEKNLIFGAGVGDELVTSYLSKPVINIVDNSYLVVLWKFGFFGFSLLALIFGIAIYQMIYLVKKTDGYSQLLAIIFLTNLLGQLVNGLACVIMILYFFNFIWVSHIAIINVLYINRKRQINSLKEKLIL